VIKINKNLNGTQNKINPNGEIKKKNLARNEENKTNRQHGDIKKKKKKKLRILNGINQNIGQKKKINMKRNPTNSKLKKNHTNMINTIKIKIGKKLNKMIEINLKINQKIKKKVV